MFVWLFVVLLAVLASGLIFLNFPYVTAAARPGSDFMLGLMVQVSAMAIEVAAIALIAEHLADRRWEPSRKILKNQLKSDLEQIFGAFLVVRINVRKSNDPFLLDIVDDIAYWANLCKAISTSAYEQAIQNFNVALSPALANDISDYILLRKQMVSAVQALMARHQLVAGALDDDSPIVDKMNEEQKDKMRKWLLVQPLTMFMANKSSSWGQPVSAAFVQLLDGAIRLGEHHGAKLAVTNLRQEMAGFSFETKTTLKGLLPWLHELRDAHRKHLETQAAPSEEEALFAIKTGALKVPLR